MYFENVLLNVLLIIVLIATASIINFLLNRHARFFMKYSSSLKINAKDIIDKYAKDNNLKIDSFPSKANNDLDNYLESNKCIFINSRHYFSSSIYTLARCIYFCSMSKVAKDNLKSYKLQNKLDSIFTLLDVLSAGLIMIGLLLKYNLLIIIGLILIFLSFISIFINLKVIKRYYKESKEYLKSVLKDDKEVLSIELIYKQELIQYLLRPLLSFNKLFPFLLSENQKKENERVKHYE